MLQKHTCAHTHTLGVGRKANKPVLLSTKEGQW